MNGFLLLIPFLLIRFGLLSVLNKGAVKRAAYFAPVVGNEILAYWIYQASNAAIFVCLCFLRVIIDFSWMCYMGIIAYILGLILCSISITNFANPSNEGFNSNGLYRFSRNPMYLAYFIFFSGCALLTQSMILGGIVLIFIICSYWIILSEERWCIEKFGESYRQYMKRVRRFI
mgnify:CR=1 FL=1